jgi:hypothetical protein
VFAPRPMMAQSLAGCAGAIGAIGAIGGMRAGGG